MSCATDAPSSTESAEQPVINQLPGNLNLILNATTTVTIGPFAQISGDVASSGVTGSVLYDVSSQQGFGNNTLAGKVTVRSGASAGHVFGNDITVDGSVAQQTLGVDPATLPAVPAGAAVTPGTVNLTVAANQSRQLCPGQFGAISLGAHAVLNLNGGVYQVSRLTLADGARLEPSEPVVILVSGNVTTGTGAAIVPSAQSLNPMLAGDIRIEVGGNVSLGDSTSVRAHLLLPGGKLTTGKTVILTGAAWARSIVIGTQTSVTGEGVFSAAAPAVPPPCNDNSACTVDTCVGSGAAVAFCRNTPVPTGTSCSDGNACNGDERCDAAGQCAAGSPATAGTSCGDGNACNGDETCNGAGTCVPGAPPVVSDGNTCTTDTCDPASGVSHAPLPDGTTCAGTGTCEAGTCSVQARTLFAINDGTQRLERIDPDTLAVTDIGPLGVSYAFGDCAFDTANSTLFMVDGRGDRGLYRIDLATGAATLVGIHGLEDVFSLGYDPLTNQLYAVDGDGVLFTLSTTTGAATAVGQAFFSSLDGLAFDTTRDTLIGLTAGSSIVSAIDVVTAQATELSEGPFINNLGMTYDAAIDRFWVADFDGRLLQLDPTQGYAQTFETVLPGAHTCLAVAPVP